MIHVRKPEDAPAVLREQGSVSTLELCRAVEAGGQKLDFDKEIYGAPSVKQALSLAQHDKCCFCESKISHVAYGDVEHFRPKAACRASTEVPERKPGYYWLAYEWSNLYLACEQCNRRHKRNLFPLEDESARVLSHHEAAKLAAERPLYIDPVGSEEDDPEKHITFREEYAKERTPRGLATREGLGLNRPELVERRRDHRALLLTLLRNVRNWLSLGCPPDCRVLAADNIGKVLGAMRDDAQYAAMSRALIQKVVPWRAIEPTIMPSELLDQLEDDALDAHWFAIPPR